jgi:peptide/nickel transport system permease protein
MVVLNPGESGLINIGHDQAVDAAVVERVIEAPPNLWIQMFKVFRQNKLAVASLISLIVVTLFCFLGPLFYHTNQNNLGAFVGQACFNLPPGQGHPLGTDPNCFDMLGRLMVGGQTSLTVGFASAAFTMTFGLAFGLIAGFRGGWVDSVMMRIVDVLLSIPTLFLLIALVTIFHKTEILLIIVIGMTGWYGVARLLRSEALTLREREYAQAVRAMGGRSRRVVWRHILPNSVSTVVTLATFAVGDSILALAALGFLGLGVSLPGTDWGSILNTSQLAISLDYWWQIYPVAVLFLIVVVSFNYIGDALRDSFEVRLRDRG